MQVADRWHLWRNVGQAVEKTVTTRRAHFAIARPTRTEAAAARPPDAVPRVVRALPEKKIITRMREQHTAVHDRRERGLSKAAIARQLGLHPATVRKLATARTLEELTAKTEQRAHLVDDHIEYLHKRWNEGERNATGLFREITARGYQGGELAVQRYLRRFRAGEDTPRFPARNPRPSARSSAGSSLTVPIPPDLSLACRAENTVRCTAPEY